ncbi:MAG: YnbE family lipoprotein [Geminicoccaceae bacterium]
MTRFSMVSCAAVSLLILLQGCQPTVQLEAPKEPIVINLNVKIEQEVRVRVERDLDELLEDPELFGG